MRSTLHSNPAYGDNAYTKLTPALTRELGSWLGLGFGKSNIQLRWLSDSPDHNSLYLYVDAGEGSRLYLKHGSGSSFNLTFLGADHSWSYRCSLEFGSGLVDVLDEDKNGTNDEVADNKATDNHGWLACVSASDHKDHPGLTIEIRQDTDEDQQPSRETITLGHRSYYFHVESTPIAGSNPGDSELFKISLLPWWSEAKPGSTRHVRFHPSSGQGSPY